MSAAIFQLASLTTAVSVIITFIPHLFTACTAVKQTQFVGRTALLFGMFYGLLLSVRMFYGPPYTCPL